MIYDCFIFNDELDLLELRLTYLNDKVDKFVLVESERTVAGSKKELHFSNHKSRFKKFEHKIIHLIAPSNDFSVWEYEFFQRNYIKEALHQCSADDIIIITDVDEILNIPSILSNKKLGLPSLIEIDMSYYFLNIKTNDKWEFPLICYWKHIENINIGSRVTYEKNITKKVLTQDKAINGWHFSYLYGYDISLYQNKIKTFTHQEFNTPYFLDEKRIQKCINFKIDIFERPEVRLMQNNSRINELSDYIKNTPFQKLIYQSPSFNQYFNLPNLYFIIYIKIYKRGKYLLRNFIKRLYHKMK